MSRFYLSPTRPLAQVPRWSRRIGWKAEKRDARWERGGDSGMGHHSWFLCPAFQAKTEPGLAGTRLNKKILGKTLDIWLWQVLYQHTPPAPINPHTWERRKTWSGFLIPKARPLGSRTEALRIAQTQLLPLLVFSSSHLLRLSKSGLRTS